MKTLILLLSITLPLTVHGSCIKGRLKSIGSKKIETDSLCFKKISGILSEYLMSKNCFDGKCKLVKEPSKIISLDTFNSKHGDPAFELCQKLGGTPQVIEYSAGKYKNFKSSRCIKDGDYVEIAFLMQLYREHISGPEPAP